MDRRTTICIWVILIGLLNFLAYAVVYFIIGGEAIGGWVDGQGGAALYFLRSSAEPAGIETSRGVFIYSGLHSITISVTVAAVMLAMLTLAKDRIVSSMHQTVVRGRTFMTILATIITLATVFWTILFIVFFHRNLAHPKMPRTQTTQTIERRWN